MQGDNRSTAYDTVIQWLYHQIFEPMNISTVAARHDSTSSGDGELRNGEAIETAPAIETAKRETASALKRALPIKRRRHSNSVALKRL